MSRLATADMTRRRGRRCRRITSRSRTCICGSCSPTTRGAASASRPKAPGSILDYSKNRITDETVRLLLQLARERGVAERRDAMFRGEKINVTEQRAVLHVALRAPRDAKILVDGQDVVPDVHAGARPHGGLRRARALRRVAGAYRQAHPQRRSISASAAPISGRRWPIARCARSATGR